MFGVTFKLLHFAGDFIDVGEEPARRLAVEARRRHQRIMPLDPLRPRPRIQLRPIAPPLLGRERRQMPPAWPGVEGFFSSILWILGTHLILIVNCDVSSSWACGGYASPPPAEFRLCLLDKLFRKENCLACNV